MTPAVTHVRRTVIGAIAAGAACATLAIPAASADPEDTPAPAPAATDDCNAATLASTISTVTTQLSTYFAAHPDANQALIDATRQPAFIAVGQFEDYTDAHPDQADADSRHPGASRRVQGPLRNAGVADRRAHGARRPLRIERRLGAAEPAGEDVGRGRQRAGALGDLRVGQGPADLQRHHHGLALMVVEHRCRDDADIMSLTACPGRVLTS